MTWSVFEKAVTDTDVDTWQAVYPFLLPPEVRLVDDWPSADRAGHSRLTEAQRVLIVWDTVVGQVSNGGLEQLVDNLWDHLTYIYELMALLEWPEFFERFDVAFRIQAGDPKSISRRPSIWEQIPGETWTQRRRRILSYVLSERRPARTAMERLAAYFDVRRTEKKLPSENALQTFVMMITSEFAQPESPEVSEFNSWFYKKETMEASRLYVGRFIRSRQSELCRIVEEGACS